MHRSMHNDRHSDSPTHLNTRQRGNRFDVSASAVDLFQDIIEQLNACINTNPSDCGLRAVITSNLSKDIPGLD